MSEQIPPVPDAPQPAPTAVEGQVPPVPPAPWMPPTDFSAGYAPGVTPGYAPAPGYVPAPPYEATGGYAQTPAYPAAPPLSPAFPGAAGEQSPYAAPYTAPSYPQYNQGIGAPIATTSKSSMLGIVALIAAIVAAIVPPILASIGAFGVGEVLVRNGAAQNFEDELFVDLSILAGGRGSVLLIEIGFWLGTVLGIWAIVQGIIAIVKRRGRGPGIAAVVVAAVAPFLFVFGAYMMIFFGVAAGIAEVANR